MVFFAKKLLQMFMIICDCSVVQVSCVVPVENVLIVIFHPITLTHTGTNGYSHNKLVQHPPKNTRLPP